MTSAPTRVFLGAAAGALSMLLFHQTTLQAFYWLGLANSAAFRLAIVPPFGVPQVVSACFWAALIAGCYGVIAPRSGPLAWAAGLPLGLLGMLLIWFVGLPMKGQPAAFGWQTLPMIRSATASLMWGLGVGILYRMLLPRCLIRSSKHGRGQRQPA
jgi:hypothetical protein